MIAPDSHSKISVLGSLMAGSLPLGLMVDVNESALGSLMSIYSQGIRITLIHGKESWRTFSYGSSSSSNTMNTFLGLGPDATVVSGEDLNSRRKNANGDCRR